MAIWYEKGWKNGFQIGVWKIEEEASFFLERLDLQEAEQSELQGLKGRRQIEWLASRYLVHLMVSDEPEWDRIPLIKDKYGKPHLDDHELYVSFSHSHEFVAVILGKMVVGIDIQKFVPKISAIARKFMRAAETKSLMAESQLEHLHFYWGAKEALYKCYGRKKLEFREHILVEPFPFIIKGMTSGIVQKDDFYQSYSLYFEQIDQYFLVYALSTD